METNHEPYGLVFGGGAARGAFEIGVWKALAELKIPVAACVGTSIGALNGALFAQGDLDLALEIWTHIRLSDVVALSEPVAVPDNLMDRRNMDVVVRDMIRGRGLDVGPLRSMLERHVDEARIRSSPVLFGLMTYSLTDMKPVPAFVDAIPEGQLVDYLLASAGLPVFQPRRIGDIRFLDGGVYNNLPTPMLVDRGFRNILEVDVGGMGIIRHPDAVDGLRIRSIRARPPYPGLFDLTPDAIGGNIRKGYLAGLREFGALSGHTFHFPPEAVRRLQETGADGLLSGLEQAGLVYGLDELSIHDPEVFMAETHRRFLEARKAYRAIGGKDRLRLDALLRRLRDRGLQSIGLTRDMLLPFLVDLLDNLEGKADRRTSRRQMELLRRVLPQETEAAEALRKYESYRT